MTSKKVQMMMIKTTYPEKGFLLFVVFVNKLDEIGSFCLSICSARLLTVTPVFIALVIPVQ